MSVCGHKWRAPATTWPGQTIVFPGDFEIPHPGYVPQECCLERGHDGPHRSLTKVTLRRRDCGERCA